MDPITSRLKGVGVGTYTAPSNGQYSLKDIVYHDAGIYKCVGQSSTNKKKLEVLNSIALGVKGERDTVWTLLLLFQHFLWTTTGFPTVSARNTTPPAFPGLPLHLFVEFCANPPAHAARWLHGDRVYTPGNQYGADVLAYGVTVSHSKTLVYKLIMCISTVICHLGHTGSFLQRSQTDNSSHARKSSANFLFHRLLARWSCRSYD